MSFWVHAARERAPDRVAIEGPERSLTYDQLSPEAIAAACGLRALDLAPGARVALALADPTEFAIALHGCLLGGHPAVPIDLRLSETERAQREAGADAVLTELPNGSWLGMPNVFAGDPVVAVMHTSGTTAAPKPIELTYGNFQASALGSAVALGLDPQERWLCPLPLAHVGGLSVVIRSAIYATTAVLHERFDADAVAALLMDEHERVTLVSLVPTMLSRLLDAGLRAPPTLRWALLGGGPIAPALLQRARDAGVPVAPTYGMTEACSQIATHGWPLAGVELRIDSEGEVLVRGPIVAPGALAPDGWLHTGDLGALDERGRLTITGRRADTIVSGGDNVAPAEVEAVLLEHPAVADAAVFGRSDAVWGEAVVATVVLRDGATVRPEDLVAHCAARIARYKVPKAIAFAQRLPRSRSGKLLRRELL